MLIPMLAAIQRAPRTWPCVIRWTGRVRLHVEVRTYCDAEPIDAADGVLQLPDNTIICEACRKAIADEEIENSRRMLAAEFKRGKAER